MSPMLSLALLLGPRESYASDVRAYLAECRALAERLPVAKPDEFKRRYDRTLELYAATKRWLGHTDRSKQIDFALSRIGFNFSLAQVVVGQREQHLRNGRRERARAWQAMLRRMEADQLNKIEHVEQLLQADARGST